MKKLLILIGIAILILTLISCGGETEITTVVPDTTAPVTTTDTIAPITTAVTTAPITTTDTTAPATTAAVTTKTPVTEPVVFEIEPQNVSFSMQYDSFMHTVLDDGGRVIRRDMYHGRTMQKTAEYHSYSYDENGKLTSLVIGDIYGDKTEHSFTFGEDGKTAIANATDKSENPYVYRVFFDDSGKIVAEEKDTGGVNSFHFDFDAKGRLAEERMFEVDREILYRFVYSNDTLKITSQSVMTKGLVVTYNNVGLPISLEGEYSTSALQGEYYSYFTYNAKGNCTVACYFAKQEENVCEHTYDEQDRLIKSVTQNKDIGTTEEIVYAYDARGNQIMRDCKLYDCYDSLVVSAIRSYRYDSCYDDHDRLIEERYSVYGEDGVARLRACESYTYNEKGWLVQTVKTEAYTIVTDYLYDESGKLCQVNEAWYVGEELYYRVEVFLKANHEEKMIEYRYAEGVLVMKTEHVVTYGQGNKVIKRENWEYDGSGNLLSHEVTEY